MSMNALTNAPGLSKPHPLVSAATAALPHVRIRMNAQFPVRTLAWQTGRPIFDVLALDPILRGPVRGASVHRKAHPNRIVQLRRHPLNPGTALYTVPAAPSPPCWQTSISDSTPSAGLNTRTSVASAAAGTRNHQILWSSPKLLASGAAHPVKRSVRPRILALLWLRLSKSPVLVPRLCYFITASAPTVPAPVEYRYLSA
ncbi:hypothetical protein HDV63DRAFT_416543 [Trichoderma sp. SZMC 28014]